MNIVDEVKKCKTYVDLVTVIDNFDNTADLQSHIQSYEHPIFILDREVFHRIYESISDIHDFNEFNSKYTEYIIGASKNHDVFIAFIEHANSYLLINNIDDIYKFATVYNEMLIVCYNRYVVTIAVNLNVMVIKLKRSYNDILVQNSEYPDITDFEAKVRDYKLKYISNL